MDLIASYRPIKNDEARPPGDNEDGSRVAGYLGTKEKYEIVITGHA